MARKVRRRRYPNRKTVLGRFIKDITEHPEWPVILCEGDSWFSYPFNTNLVVHFRNKGHVSLLNDARNGDRVDSMAFGKHGKKFRKYLKRFEFDYIFISGGGNDILANGRIREFLKETASPSDLDDYFDKERFAGALNKIEKAYREIIRLRDQTRQRPIIVTHGYDVPIVNNGVDLLVLQLGPWLYKYLEREGVPLSVHHELAEYLINEFNEVLVNLSAETDRFIHVDTRGLLPEKKDWVNEIHPTGVGFAKIAEKIWSEAGLA